MEELEVEEEVEDQIEFEFEFVEELTSYQILGVDQKDNLSQINAVYRQLLLIFHPDKYNTVDSQRLGLSNEEKEKTFDIIQKAYKDILLNKKETNAPDYDMKYNIDNDLFLLSTDLEKINEAREKHYIFLNEIANYSIKVHSGQSPKKENKKEEEEEKGNKKEYNKNNKTDSVFFNKRFEERWKTEDAKKETESKSKAAEATEAGDETGIGFKIGYGSDFETKQRQEEHNYIKQHKKRIDIDIAENDKSEITKQKTLDENSMILHSFYEQTSFKNNNKNEINYMELGLSTLDSYTCDSGSDLSEVYCNNWESFEESYKRTNKIIDNKKDGLTDLNELIKQRDNIHNEIDNSKFLERMKKEEKFVENIEKSRQIKIQKQNRVYKINDNNDY